MNAEGISERLLNLSETIAQRPSDSVPIIRSFFPKKIRLMPEGKARVGETLYSMRGEFTLNGVIVENFDRPVTQKKNTGDGETASSIF